MTCYDVTGNSDLFEGKPRSSSILKDITDRVNSIIQSDLMDAGCKTESASSILTAGGVWLDYIGERLMFPRPKITSGDYLWFGFDGNGYGFDQAGFVPGNDSDKIGIVDDAYRALLILRGGQLITDCTAPALNATLTGAFGAGTYIDNGNMTIDVIIPDTQPDIIIKALYDSGLISKPAGVQLISFMISHSSGTFGFDGNGVGFDQGLFIRTIEELII